MDYDRRDAIALSAAKGDTSLVGVLSTGERLYVALAAGSVELLEQDNFTIAEALARLGDDEVAQFIERWRYRGNPKKY